MPAETPAAPVAPVTPAAAPAPANASAPAIPAAQSASVSTTPKPAPEVPSAPGFQQSESIESLMKKVAKEAFSKEATDGKELVVTPVEKKPEAAKPDAKAKVPAEKSKVETPVAPVEKDALEGIEPPEGASEKTVKDWKAFREKASEEINRVKNERASIAAELATYKKSTPADAADIAKLKADLQASNDRLAVLDLTSHPDFQRQFSEPKKKALATASALLADNAVEGAPDIAALLDRPRGDFSKALTEAALKLPLFDQADFMANAREAYRLHGEEKGQLANASQLRQQLQAKSAQEARTAFESSRAEFTTRIPSLEIPDGASKERIAEINEFNAAREATMQEAERMTFGKMTEREVADVATRAAALNMMAHHVLPKITRDRDAANTLVAQLTAELTAIKQAKSSPSFSGDQSAAPKDPSKMTFHDAMEEAKRRG